MRILFCNIGWMNHYNGQTETDLLENGGKFVKENGYGIEEFTFQNRNGYYYGGTGSEGNMHIERIEGVDKYADKAENVLVVWVAKKDNEENSRIIGWYKNALVYREFQSFNTLDDTRSTVYYRIKAKAEDSILLMPGDRSFIMPRANKSADKVGMGRSNIWYAEKKEAKPFVDEVIDYIDKYNRKKCNFVVTEETLNRSTTKELDGCSDYIDKAYELSDENRNRDALEYINRGLNLEPNNEYAYNCKGNVLLDLGLYDLAIDVFEKALECNKEYTDSIFNIGLCYGMDGNYKKALEYFDRYLAIYPNDEDSIYYKRKLL